MIGFGYHLATFITKRIVGCTPPFVGQLKAISKRNPFNSGNAKQSLRQEPFYCVKPRLSYTGRDSGDHRFQNTANAISLCGGLFNGSLHPSSCRFRQNGKTLLIQLFHIDFQIFKIPILHTGTAGHMGGNMNSFLRQSRQQNSSGSNQPGSNTTAKMPASAIILVAMILTVCSIICMAGTRQRTGGRIVLGVLGSIGN